MSNIFQQLQLNKLRKIIKSRLNKDGFVLMDAIIAFTLLTMLTVLILGFMSTAIRTAPLIESDAEDLHASMTAISQAIAKTSDVEEMSLNLSSYVPSRSLTEPSAIKLYNNYDTVNKKLVGNSAETFEILTSNIIPASSMMVYVHPTSNQWIQSVITTKAKGAVFTFEPTDNLVTDNRIPTTPGFFNLYREEPQRSKLKMIDTLNYPKSYIESEMMIYENTIK